MALVTRYFSTAAAGAGDGTTWANRAALFSAGNWSSVITAFDFTTDALQARIGPGTYSCSQELNNTVITGAADPTLARQLYLHGADSSGNLLTPPDVDWVSAMPPWSDSSLPVIATTGNIITTLVTNNRLIKFTASGRSSGYVVTGGDWIVVINSSSATGAQGVGFGVTNSFISMTGNCDYAVGSSSYNSRIQGVTGTSGNRRGFYLGSSSMGHRYCTVIGFGGSGASSIVTTGNQSSDILRSTFVNNGTGVSFHNSGTFTATHSVSSCVVTGSTGWGVNCGTSFAGVYNTRLRNNTSGNITNYPASWSEYGNDTSAGTDADEFVDSANGDYRIKYGSAFWGKGIGAGDGPATIVG